MPPLLNNLSFHELEANHLKFKHNVSVHKRKISNVTTFSILEWCPLICRKTSVLLLIETGASMSMNMFFHFLSYFIRAGMM